MVVTAAAANLQGKNLSLSLEPDRHDLRIKSFPVLAHTILQSTMSFIFPHSQDETYETCETSANVDVCASCRLRDLAQSDNPNPLLSE
ncbi:hypothetical protein CDEST_15397 [Colletotrichum destructivum]|uniref:Uncharacterized protein n=1 Tax=Colletotrichum destructivum TaxID=34406 RepID=A0AAX4J4U1_9PEZI|nr:hypothetical protein CDEST_15397 [Colletotrichum destructivum]